MLNAIININIKQASSHLQIPVTRYTLHVTRYTLHYTLHITRYTFISYEVQVQVQIQIQQFFFLLSPYPNPYGILYGNSINTFCRICNWYSNCNCRLDPRIHGPGPRFFQVHATSAHHFYRFTFISLRFICSARSIFARAFSCALFARPRVLFATFAFTPHAIDALANSSI